MAAALLLFSNNSFAEDASKPSAQETSQRTGYVDCSHQEKNDLVPILLNVCTRLPAGNLKCGQKVAVLERQGPWTKITLSDGISRYIDANVLSQVADKFVAFDVNSGLIDSGPPNCTFKVGGGISAPHAIYYPDPEYSDKARKAHIQGTLTLSLLVGADGRPHDLKVQRGLGYGLDEEAIKAVKRWKFDPAVRDGKPVEASINIEVSFRMWDRH